MKLPLKRKLVVEIIYESRTDALDLLKQIHYHNISDLGDMKQFKNGACMQVTKTFVKPLIEPRIEIINGNQCMVFTSLINFTE